MINSFIVLFLVATISNISVYAKHSSKPVKEIVSLKLGSTTFAPPAQPTGVSDLYYCTGDPAAQLSAVGTNLKWYTTASGGTPSTVAPTPSTATAGSTIYYVTQTVAGEESTRKAITVNVNKQFNLFCAGVTPNSVNFDFPNVGQSRFDYSYTVNGGPPVTGSQVSPSSFTVTGLAEGTTVVLTVTAVGAPSCVLNSTLTASCKTRCTTIPVPNFPAIAPFCSGSAPPILASTSPNGISGTWSPAIINNTTGGNYVFTPNTVLFPCATTQTLAVTVNPLATPTFTSIPTTVCHNAAAPILPTSSTNSTPITGTWIPATVNTTVLGPITYTFNPAPGQCVSATPTSVIITIVPVVTPNFAAIPPICSGTAAPILSNTSPNGIVGTWSPSIINNTASGNYLFTPNANQCATTQTLTVTITPKSTPNFAAIPSFCSGTLAPTLATTSPNGITGTWSPTTISNTASGSYVFTPNATECATNQTLTVTINPLIQPNFTGLAVCTGGFVPSLNGMSPNGISGTWTPSIIDNTTSGTYVFTPNPDQCATSQTITVSVNPANTLNSVSWTVADAFANNQIVTIIASGTGEYLYQLDSGPFQDSPIFEYVSSGTHSATVIDKNGCSPSITINDILVINYPKFFTPNSDGHNDTWNIFSLLDQPSSKILIFDRYGKLLKQIFPDGLGWDGTYIGHPMPANDYWFSVEYLEQNIPKKYKAHFSLKR